MKADAVIVSAGKGLRFMEGKKKQFYLLAGRPILAHTLDQFEACPLIRSIVLVVGPEDIDFCRNELLPRYGYRKIGCLIPGGEQRQKSVKNGIDAVPDDAEVIVIHDGVRPMVTPDMIEESIRSAFQHRAVVFALPVKDTIKMADADGIVVRTLDRDSLWQIQTPQSFQTHVIKEAHRKAEEDGFVGTDDAALVERLGVNVRLLRGSDTNIKITTPEDLTLAHLFLRERGQGKTDQSLGREEG